MDAKKKDNIAISPSYNKPYNKYTQEVLKEYGEMKTNKEKYKRYNSVDEMFKDMGIVL